MSRPDWARSRGSATTKEQLTIDSEEYAQDVIEEYDLDVDIGDINFEASARLTRAHGNCRSKDGEHFLIKVSWNAYENHGWESLRDTIRHELAHVVQHSRHGYTNHDWRFREIANELDAPAGADESAATPEYVIECTECSAIDYRQNRSRVVKHPEDYHCGECGGDLISYEYEDSND